MATAYSSEGKPQLEGLDGQVGRVGEDGKDSVSKVFQRQEKVSARVHGPAP